MANIRLSNIMTSIAGRVPKTIPLFGYSNSVQAIMDMTQPANVDCGTLDANTWKTAYSSSDAGVLLAATIIQNSNTSQTIGMRVYFDDALVGELVVASSNITNRGITTFPGLGSYSITPAYGALAPMYPFNSLRIDVQSSIARTAGSSVSLKVINFTV